MPPKLQAIVDPIEGNQEPLMRPLNPSFGIPSALWTERRAASRNWLALGLLLAAWNAADDSRVQAHPAARRPERLRGYSYVSVRAASALEP